MQSFITSHRQGALGLINLNRPEALNALDRRMIDDIAASIKRFNADTAVQRILIQSLSPKAFCAGGDVRAAVTAPYAEAVDYFRAEYRLNYTIATNIKPIFALIDGLALGGGLGLALNAPVCIVTERASLAMPEMAIGLFPDVGAAHFLNRAPAPFGLWMAMTGTRITGADAMHLDLAQYYLDSTAIPTLVSALEMNEPLPRAAALPPFSLLEQRDEIIHCFSAGTVDQILTAVAHTPYSLHQACPTSLYLALRHIHQGAHDSLKTVLERDFTLAQRCLERPDFPEGVRAMLIDKDKAPQFRAADRADIAAHFMPSDQSLFEP